MKRPALSTAHGIAPPARRRVASRAAILALLVAAPLAVFGQVVGFGFVNYDDPAYASENAFVRAGLGWDGVRWAFSTLSMGHWHPLTWLSLMLDASLGGGGPGAFHAANLALHVASTLLLFAVLERMTGRRWPSALVAALFALHPLHVEPVAWVASRKDVLSGLFFMLALAAWARYAERPSVGRYVVVAVAFALGLLAKPMLVTLPAVLLLLDAWPLGRFAPAGASRRERAARAGRLLVEKAPLVALSAAAATLAWVGQSRAGAIGTADRYPLGLRIENALVACATYLWRTAWPGGLAVFYPHSEAALTDERVAGAALLLAAVSAAALALARRRPCLLVGWAWFLVTLLPVIGLVQLGRQAMADRYTYLPLVGIFVMVAFGPPYPRPSPSESATASTEGRRLRALAAPALAALALGACMALSFVHARTFHDSVALFEHALAVTEDNTVAHNNLGCALRDQGATEAAVGHFREALRLDPRYPDAHFNLATALLAQGRREEAAAHYEETLRLDPRYPHPDLRSNLAGALLALGRVDEAIAHCRQALAITPRHAAALANLGAGLMLQHRDDEAMARFTEALAIDPRQADARNDLGILLAQRGRLEEAIAQFDEVLRQNPQDAAARDNLERARREWRARGGAPATPPPPP